MSLGLRFGGATLIGGTVVPVEAQGGQATVEWTGLALLVAIGLVAAAAGAGQLGAAGLTQRLACGLLGEQCHPRRALDALNEGPPKVFHAHVPVRGSGPLSLAAAVAPGPAAISSVVRFVRRNGKLIRKVVVGTAIGIGVGATCAGALVAANAIGGAMCGSSIITGGYAAYRNATD